METLKLLVAYFLSPLSLAIVLLLCGWILIWRKKSRVGLSLLAVATVVLIAGSFSGFTYAKRRANEYIYSPFSLEESALHEADNVRILVLGAGFNADDYLPPNSRVSSAFLARVIESVRVHRLIPNSHLIISVAGKADPEIKRATLREIADLFALDPSAVEVITEAESTRDEAEMAKEIAEGFPLVVVTSAGHMPRAIQIMEDAGLEAHPAPTDYAFTRAESPNDKPWQRWIPSTEGIGSNQQFFYEALAMLARRF